MVLRPRITKKKKGWNKKMGRKKQIKIKTFKVKKGELEYYIIEQLEKKKVDFSKLIRNLLISEFSNKKEFKDAKINRILNERKNLKSKIPKISNELINLEKQLNKLGYKLQEDE
jgi:hypothetical protein